LQLEKTQQMVQEIHLPIPNSLASSNIEQWGMEGLHFW
jgi:hypothetical protein